MGSSCDVYMGHSSTWICWRFLFTDYTMINQWKTTIKGRICLELSTHFTSKSKWEFHLPFGFAIGELLSPFGSLQTQVWDHKTWHEHHPNPHWIPPHPEGLAVKALKSKGGSDEVSFWDTLFSGFTYCIMLVSRRLLSLSYLIFFGKKLPDHYE